jgi:GT2 family glycosyltransferase
LTSLSIPNSEISTPDSQLDALAILMPMRIALVIPTLGASHLQRCLQAVSALDPAPTISVVVCSGAAELRSLPADVTLLRHHNRLGFAAAVNAGIAALADDVEGVAVLNDDAVPETSWLGTLGTALESDPRLASVQGTVFDAEGRSIDGRGIVFDRYGLPVQIDRGAAADADTGHGSVLAVSGTAGLYRKKALNEVALAGPRFFDQSFDCYHEDLDLGLRLHRLGWRARWVGRASSRHFGSTTGPTMRWRHPWWVLANRWRALAGNLSPSALLVATPRLMRGEIRAVRTLVRTNTRVIPTAAAVVIAMPALTARGWLRKTPGPRLKTIPEPAP